MRNKCRLCSEDATWFVPLSKLKGWLRAYTRVAPDKCDVYEHDNVTTRGALLCKLHAAPVIDALENEEGVFYLLSEWGEPRKYSRALLFKTLDGTLKEAAGYRMTSPLAGAPAFVKGLPAAVSAALRRVEQAESCPHALRVGGQRNRAAKVAATS